MKENVGVLDRILRVIFALTIAGLYAGGAISGMPALGLGFVAIVLAATAVVGWCPLYEVLGISTRRRGAAHT